MNRPFIVPSDVVGSMREDEYGGHPSGDDRLPAARMKHGITRYVSDNGLSFAVESRCSECSVPLWLSAHC
ncbi:MAG: hypothetical protein KDA88_20365, partial [Planctomycetaceae bacterium]|nr:hypothetical protein [Planctomycetaceae bacterium]